MSGLFRIDRTGRRCYLQDVGRPETGDWAFPFAFCLFPFPLSGRGGEDDENSVVRADGLLYGWDVGIGVVWGGACAEYIGPGDRRGAGGTEGRQEALNQRFEQVDKGPPLMLIQWRRGSLRTRSMRRLGSF